MTDKKGLNYGGMKLYVTLNPVWGMVSVLQNICPQE
jgi:hypothetical protein